MPGPSEYRVKREVIGHEIVWSVLGPQDGEEVELFVVVVDPEAGCLTIDEPEESFGLYEPDALRLLADILPDAYEAVEGGVAP